MRIGVPKEVKTLEGRVGLIPDAAAELIHQGHSVCIQSGAGALSGYRDEDYRALGVDIKADAASLYADAEMIVKVKEPIAEDLRHLEKRHLLFCYLHLAAVPELAKSLLDIGLTAVAFETVSEGGRLPLLAPMSDIAGRLSVQIGTHLLHQPQGGKGVLLGGLPAAERGEVVILGAGMAGGAAATVAASLGANVTVFAPNRDQLERMRALGPNVTALYPYRESIYTAVKKADLLVGAVLVTGERSPYLVTRNMVQEMQPGSVIVDISVDQGGCVETTRPTTYADPTYLDEGIVHFAVTNMPGAVPRTSSKALSASLLPYVLRLAQKDWRQDVALQAGINVDDGELVHPGVRKSLPELCEPA